MAINLKAKETLIQVGELKGKYRYVLSTELYNKLPESKVIKEAALRSGVSRGVMQACWDAAGEVIKAWSTEGHSVAIPGLGTMRFGVRAKSVATVGEVAGSLITTRRVIFTPNVDIKDELQRTPIQITCIDRNGKVVKNVTSGDGGNVEDPDKDPNGGGTNGGSDNTEGGGSGNTEGGGSGNTEGGGTSGGDAGGDVGL
ncbi:DNA-binding protein [Prevotella copri]|uniref:DNA-binding protein n=1 Tax=Segatella copri TaxID=165179 RepID=A0A6G1TYM6_9BACT|nr:DNA-binding protein [Segatella copri]MQN80266.1 DNA-binding protein [Segatella copri]